MLPSSFFAEAKTIEKKFRGLRLYEFYGGEIHLDEMSDSNFVQFKNQISFLFYVDSTINVKFIQYFVFYGNFKPFEFHVGIFLACNLHPSQFPIVR